MYFLTMLAISAYRFLSVLALLLGLASAHAGVFDLPSFLEQGQWSAGLEPEIILSDGVGAGFNFKPRFGATDFLNWEGLIGTGTGARKFRIGAIADFEWFPDFERQPGFASPAFIEYYRFNDDGLLSFGVKPMIYKTFEGQDAAYTPFIAVPLGWNYSHSNAPFFTQVAMGCLFKLPSIEHWKFTAEAAFNVKNSYSSISGGITYFH